MEPLAVQCLRCSTSRIVRRTVFNRLDSPECPTCGYLGWTPVLEATRAAGRGRRIRSRAELRLTSVA